MNGALVVAEWGNQMEAECAKIGQIGQSQSTEDKFKVAQWPNGMSHKVHAVIASRHLIESTHLAEHNHA